MNFIEELKYRGMFHTSTPEVEELLIKEQNTAYLGIDPTAPSLHIGHLVAIFMLKYFQKCGHIPILLVGGATSMIGDPSGKSEERKFIDKQTIQDNIEAIKSQLYNYLDFDSKTNPAIILNNADWINDMTFVEFIRDIGKHITINYMIAKDSVQKRMQTGLSFTEFTYQLLQGYDFFYLFQNYNCKIQLGGSDQWGNITTGIELIRRKIGKDSFAITCPLLTKADGSKFGKTEKGNIWLDRKLTSPYQFYQFWLNVSDEDAERFIKIFTFLTIEEIENLIAEHRQMPEKRILQQTLAREITTFIHSETDYLNAKNATNILFGNTTREALENIDEAMFVEIFENVPQFEISLENKDTLLENLLIEQTKIFQSKGELRRLIENNGLLINKEKITNLNEVINEQSFINNKFLLVQKGKKNYYLIVNI